MIWDELSDEFPFELLLQLLDRYELRVETKGGHVQFTCELNIITTNKPLEDFYREKTECMNNASFRRVNGYLTIEDKMYN